MKTGTPAVREKEEVTPARKKRAGELKNVSIAVILASIAWMACSIFAPRVLPFIIPVPVLWLINLAFFIADGIAIGYCITGNVYGIFINERKLMSISRVQVAFWTLLILSAFFTIFVVRLRAGVNDPINIGIDSLMWGVMGISLGSLAGRTALMGRKASAEPKPETMTKASEEAAKNLAGENANVIKANSTGVLYVNESINDASLMDMFQGDEVGNTWVIDIGKVQMFFFTVVLLIAYASQIWAMLLHTDIGQMTDLPTLTEGFVALLGISHAGLLASSGVTLTPVK